MEVLWSQNPLAASDITERLSKRTRWSPKTVNTLLARLVEKGAADYQSEGRRYLYRPLIERAAYARDEAASLTDKLFGGRVAPMIAHLADGRGLSADDVAEIETLIQELKRERD